MTYRVEVTDEALADLEGFIGGLAERSVAAAERWYAGVRATIARLSSHPERRPLAPESEWYNPGLREIYHGKRRSMYRILFVIQGDVVSVIRVRHGRQDILKPGEM